MPLLGTRGAASAKGFGLTASGLTIGQPFGGGYYTGQISTAGTGVADYYLIVSPQSTGESPSGPYKTSNTDDPGATSAIDGPANSIAINDAAHPPAFFCKALTIGGYTDWYMPAFQELEICYYNLKPTTQANVTTTGINPYAVPPRASNYTSGNPAQTTATDFQSGGIQMFSNNYNWSSTQNGASNAYMKRFTNGTLFSSALKAANSFPTRAVRRVPV
jgi:hypothetical protein